MHTEHLHRTLSPEAYADLQDHLRLQAESQRQLAVQAVFFGWPRLLLQWARHAIFHPHALSA